MNLLGLQRVLVGVDLDYRTVPGALRYRVEVTPLGEDEHGLWLGVRGGTPVLTAPGNAPVSPLSADVVLLVTDTCTVKWYEPSSGVGYASAFAVHVDVTTWVRREVDRVIATDLSLRVVRRWSGAIEVLERAAFACDRQRDGYPDELVEQATETTRRVTEALVQGRTPFRDSHSAHVSGWFRSVLTV